MAGHRSLSQARAGLLPFGTLGARGSNHSRLEPKWRSLSLSLSLSPCQQPTRNLSPKRWTP